MGPVFVLQTKGEKKSNAKTSGNLSQTLNHAPLRTRVPVIADSFISKRPHGAIFWISYLLEIMLFALNIHFSFCKQALLSTIDGELS